MFDCPAEHNSAWFWLLFPSILQCNNNRIIPLVDKKSSFFEELFKNVVKKLGREGFLAKFELKSNGDYDFQEELMEAIDRILNDATAIG